MTSDNLNDTGNDCWKYYWEENRLKTFRKWPFDNTCSCNIKTMAEAGFYACGSQGEEDLAKCFFCGKELDGWEPDDDPWVEHKKHSKNCVFLKFNRPQCKLTVSEHTELIKRHCLTKLEEKTEEIMKQCQEEFDKTLGKLSSKY